MWLEISLFRMDVASSFPLAVEATWGILFIGSWVDLMWIGMISHELGLGEWFMCFLNKHMLKLLKFW